MIMRSLSALRWYMVNMVHWLSHRHPRLQGPNVYFDVRENHWHRYLHILIIFFMERGYNVHVRHRWHFIASWASHDLFRRSGTFTLFSSGTRAKDGRFFTDRVSRAQHTLLDADYHHLPGIPPSGLRLPMPLVDSQYVEHAYNRHPVTVDAPRQRGVFFFGNMDPVAYARAEVRDVFGCMDRTTMLALVRRHFVDRVHAPRSMEEIGVRSGRDIVLTDRRDVYIEPADLLSVLARFDFFLAPSGVVMPLCHNLVEALCAGCIPVLQHPHLMEPPLRDGVDCLAFADEAGLVTVLERIGGMSEESVRQIRRNVIGYYQQHLTPAAVIGMIEKRGASLDTLHVNAELLSTRILRKKLDAAGITGPLPRTQ